MSDYDVVVIGAGNGGLTSALTLARNGAKVLLLERHNIPGGCATSFIRAAGGQIEEIRPALRVYPSLSGLPLRRL